MDHVYLREQETNQFRYEDNGRWMQCNLTSGSVLVCSPLKCTRYPSAIPVFRARKVSSVVCQDQFAECGVQVHSDC